MFEFFDRFKEWFDDDQYTKTQDNEYVHDMIVEEIVFFALSSIYLAYIGYYDMDEYTK
jgi:hypothetical protein